MDKKKGNYTGTIPELQICISPHRFTPIHIGTERKVSIDFKKKCLQLYSDYS